MDVLISLSPPMSNLRGQTTARTGQYERHVPRPRQATIAEAQPLALLLHCGTHCTNLVSQSDMSTGARLTSGAQRAWIVVFHVAAWSSSVPECRRRVAADSTSLRLVRVTASDTAHEPVRCHAGYSLEELWQFTGCKSIWIA